jgi:hypothetical protein
MESPGSNPWEIIAPSGFASLLEQVGLEIRSEVAVDQP